MSDVFFNVWTTTLLESAEILRVVGFCRFGDRQACKTPVLGEIINLWLST